MLVYISQDNPLSSQPFKTPPTILTFVHFFSTSISNLCLYFENKLPNPGMYYSLLSSNKQIRVIILNVSKILTSKSNFNTKQFVYDKIPHQNELFPLPIHFSSFFHSQNWFNPLFKHISVPSQPRLRKSK